MRSKVLLDSTNLKLLPGRYLILCANRNLMQKCLSGWRAAKLQLRNIVNEEKPIWMVYYFSIFVLINHTRREIMGMVSSGFKHFYVLYFYVLNPAANKEKEWAKNGFEIQSKIFGLINSCLFVFFWKLP